jgi:hypothetical protein
MKKQTSSTTAAYLAIVALAAALAASVAANVYQYGHREIRIQFVLPPPRADEERYEHAPGSGEWHPNFGVSTQFCGMFGAEHCSHAT